MYGCRGRAKRSGVVAASTTKPAYMTLMRLVIPATTPRSCVMRMTAVSSSAVSRWSSSSTWAWIVTSSAVVGSSAMRSLGSSASAMAIMTRCRMPPLNWCGKSRSRPAGSAMPTRPRSSIARARASAAVTCR